jgi:hypothetical protein
LVVGRQPFEFDATEEAPNDMAKYPDPARSRFALTAALLILPCFIVTIAAESSVDLTSFSVSFTPQSSDLLPDQLRSRLERYDEFTRGTDAIPDVLRVALMDLNSDGVNEYLVLSSQPYSGGPALYVFELREGSFIEIGSCQGGIKLGAPKNGYLEIQCTSRGGAESYRRSYLNYEEDRYVVTKVVEVQP